jgi:hypothetical protein
MADLIPFPGHKLHGPWCCQEERCVVCEGGLMLCETCGGAEAAMPTHCPGHRLSGLQLDLVQALQLDFLLTEGWVEIPDRQRV